MINMLKYTWLVIKHKWFVFLAGLKTGAPLWNLIIHDLSKFSLSEFPHYVRQFFFYDKDLLEFTKAWNHHQKYNKHHWEYWVLIGSYKDGNYPNNSSLPMPEKYVREMLADWMGACRAYEGNWPKDLDSWKWWKDNFNKINLHSETRKLCLKIMKEII